MFRRKGTREKFSHIIKGGIMSMKAHTPNNICVPVSDGGQPEGKGITVDPNSILAVFWIYTRDKRIYSAVLVEQLVMAR